jgi:hypothetical protein
MHISWSIVGHALQPSTNQGVYTVFFFATSVDSHFCSVGRMSGFAVNKKYRERRRRYSVTREARFVIERFSQLPAIMHNRR